ncbi:MAG: histone deacetylase family protein [Actinomycetia bacterium]|nr:histone deacetylase family protein [Actinomycetes bacterium]MCP3911030.1 histone deacetylase family protein [Actinomycetes bacterium]MCP4084377.1 histone deacetylase family protein [Actinomycetes bacterium]
MDVFHHPGHHRHDPAGYISRGTRIPCPEVPERGDVFLAAVRGAGHQLHQAGEPEEAPIAAVHDAGYLAFLAEAWDHWSALPGHGPEIVPNIHPNRNMSAPPGTIIGRAGVYQADTACPIASGTWESARQSAQCATEAARRVGGGEVDRAYALCRPPGHHAYADMAGGFCFVNNSAVAAQTLLDGGAGRVAIVDVDVHHGNGTQGIFYSRDDVLTVSLHGDPTTYYPFYAGFGAERGEGAGTGHNLNVPLPQGTGDDEYLLRLRGALEPLDRFEPDHLVVALGLDASEHDPLAFLAITTDGFRRIAEVVGGLGLPTVLVQEGGYLSEVLGQNLASFLDGFEGAR